LVGGLGGVGGGGGGGWGGGVGGWGVHASWDIENRSKHRSIEKCSPSLLGKQVLGVSRGRVEGEKIW